MLKFTYMYAKVTGSISVAVKIFPETSSQTKQ